MLQALRAWGSVWPHPKSPSKGVTCPEPQAHAAVMNAGCDGFGLNLPGCFEEKPNQKSEMRSR